MKIASQLVSAAPSNNVKSTSPEDSGAGFQSVLANAKSTVPPAPASKDALTSANSRTTETKKKDGVPDQPAVASLPVTLTLAPVPVAQTAVLPVADAPVAQKDGEQAQGASLTGQFAASAGMDESLAAVAKGAATDSAGRDISIAKVTDAASKIDAVAEPASANGSLHALASAASAERAATADAAAKVKSSPGQGSVSEAGSTPQDGASKSISESNPDTSPIAAAQNIAAFVPSPAMSQLDQMSASQVLELRPAMAGKSFEGVSSAAPLKAPAGAAVKGRPVSDDLRGKKSDDTESNQAGGGGANGAPFTAKIADAMAVAPRNASGTQSAIDAAGLQQAAQTSGHAAGQAGVQTTSQGPAATQDGKAALDTAAQAASGAQAPARADAMQGVSSAHLVQSANSSEMRLGMQSAEFGNISISTSLNHQSLSAQISIDHSELGRALAAHLPAIEEKLGTAYGVQAKVELRDSNNPSQSGDTGYSNSGQQSKEQRQSQAGAGQAGAGQGNALQGVSAAGISHNTASSRMSSLTSSMASGRASRLDIRI